MSRAEERRARRRGSRQSRGKAKRTGIRRFFTWKKILGTLFGLCLLTMGALYLLYLMVPIPDANATAKLQSNVYKYADGTHLARTGEVNRANVGLDRIPKKVQMGFVAAENASFYKDNGVDLKGSIRGAWNTLSGQGKQAGSTITQQYVKNYYLNQEQTVTRKLKELVISLKVDQRHSKDEILAGYLNTSYFGRGAYGIQAAAQAYYGVDSHQLTVQQGAYLAALLQAPTQYDWALASDTGKRLATHRWNYVLDQLVKMKELDAAQRSVMTFPTPVAPKPAPGMQGQTGYLVQAANAEMRRQGVSDAELQQGGWTITLSIDRKKQKLLEAAVRKELTDRLDARKKADQDVQAGSVSVDPQSGAVLALYGGREFLKHQLSNATTDTYQPASTFKPLILAAALDNKATTQDGRPIGANTLYNGDTRRPVRGLSGDGYAPPNLDEASYGDIRVQEAMNKSVNTAFAQMGADVGLDAVKETAVRLGLDGMREVTARPAMTLGAYGASPMQMAAAYATLANHGKKVTPSIVKSAGHKDRTYDPADPIGEQVLTRETADTVTKVLTGVVDDGTARASVREAPGRAGRPVAGKTGTSDNNKSAWFVGYTPKLVTAVGLWGEAASPRRATLDGRTTTVPKGGQTSIANAAGTDGRVNGGALPARIWSAYAFAAVGDDTSEFDLRSGQETDDKPSPTASGTPSDVPPPPPSSSAPSSSAPPSSAPPPNAPPTVPDTPTAPPPSPTPSDRPSTSPPPSGPSRPGDPQDEGSQ
ncbi:transglycosylase domain-containing protein [Streptomyces sp. NPDC059009]|uniref:transglycosylase domain-containing protein n=1 Tax=Streptomyces sp. NPDC059009 TaxID=3346694 RepID=UPI0036AF30BA